MAFGARDRPQCRSMIDSSKWEVLEAGLRVVQGKSGRQLHLPEGGRGRNSCAAPGASAAYGAAAVVMLFDERGQADTYERKIGGGAASLQAAHRRRIPRRRHHLRPQRPGRGHGYSEAHDGYAKAFIDAVALDQARTCPTPRFRAACRTSRSPSAATTPCARRCTRRSSTTPSERVWTWAIVNPADAASLQRDRTRTARTGRGRDPLPPRRRRRTAHGIRPRKCSKTGADAAAGIPTHGARGRSAERIDHAMLKGVADYIEQDALEGYRDAGHARWP